jgi:hypothetical protein
MEKTLSSVRQKYLAKKLLSMYSSPSPLCRELHSTKSLPSIFWAKALDKTAVSGSESPTKVARALEFQKMSLSIDTVHLFLESSLYEIILMLHVYVQNLQEPGYCLVHEM